MIKFYSERQEREYSELDIKIALQFYQIAQRFDNSLVELKTLDDIKDLDAILAIAKSQGFDLHGGRMARMFEQKILDTKLHSGKPQIYTSYYGNSRVLDNYGVVKVRIALYSPRYHKKHDACLSLAPSASLLSDIKNDKIGTDTYTVRYEKEISKLDPQKVYDEIISFGNGKDVAILCYEKPPEFCHRHIAADWFKDKLGIKLIEFPFK